MLEFEYAGRDSGGAADFDGRHRSHASVFQRLERQKSWHYREAALDFDPRPACRKRVAARFKATAMQFMTSASSSHFLSPRAKANWPLRYLPGFAAQVFGSFAALD